MKINFDVKKFWEENDLRLSAMPDHKRGIPIYFWLDDHYLLDTMKPPSTKRYYEDYPYRIGLHKAINDSLEKEIGKRFYDEDAIEPPRPNRFEVIMGSFWKITEGGTPWLESTVQTIEDVKKLIDRACKIDMPSLALPENWKEIKEAYEKASGKKLVLGGDGNFCRGPATMATSILGTSNTCIFIMTEPDVMKEFFTVLGECLIRYHHVLMKETGHDTRQGYSVNDDNCYLFPPALYETYCAPLLQRVFKEFAPLPSHKRYQHSDSAMGHLMGILNDLGLNQVNFGPTLHPSEIRKTMPKALIFGQMPPFTLRNGSRQEIIAIVKRDIDTVGRDGNFIECTAGSVAGGTSFENIKTYMWAVSEYGK